MSKMGIGTLIVFTGQNGAGKTSIIKELVSYYSYMCVKCKVYKFPNRHNPINGKKIDDYLNKRIEIKSKYDVLDMFATDRAWSRDSIIEDIYNGYIVFCDRYIYDAIAYQIPLTASLSQIQLYSDIIGYFDKKMPLPTMTYVIDGNFLQQRHNLNEERFHYSGYKSKQIFNIIMNVVKMKTKKYTILSNHDQHLNHIVRYIISDINVYLDIKSCHQY